MFVNSDCTTRAIDASGNSRVTASHIDVVGGVRRTDNAVLSPDPTTGAEPIPIRWQFCPLPMAVISVDPPFTRGTPRRPCNPVSIRNQGVGQREADPAAGHLRIKGGGLQVSGNASLTGPGV